LYHLVDKVKTTEIQHQEISAFLPAVYEKLKGIGKEEIIQRFVSAEFNRFLSCYRNAPDINVDLKKKEGGSGVVRLFVNIGLLDRFTPKSLKIYLTETSKVANLRIVNVDVIINYSSFETDSGQASALIAAFQKVSAPRGCRVQIEPADRRNRQENDNKRYPKSRDLSAQNKKGKRY